MIAATTANEPGPDVAFSPELKQKTLGGIKLNVFLWPLLIFLIQTIIAGGFIK
ncbi:MAG: hypothetical protein H0V01_08350 [Bacteroidetes bacterium]|nr:hypothetical protein [Bacteroidota bacterium]HET6243718.1 hypothetical protein [Bacteroidia bacterium]